MNKIKMMTLGFAALALAGGVPAQADEADVRGTGSNHQADFRGWVGMGAQPENHTASYRSTGGTASYNCNNTATGGGRVIRYPFTLPDSRQLEFVRVWGEKLANTADIELRVQRSCMAQSEVNPVTVTLGDASVTGAPGHFSALVSVDDTPNNLDCRYWLDVQFGTSATACAQNSSSLRITKVRTHGFMNDRIFRGTFHVNAP